jgi:S1-C subfamily serine protease
MRVGEDVFAIGNPSGILPGSVTVGTIGYINREVTITGIGDMTLVQLNVDIYHGSSGGALFNMYGEVIGITNSGSDTYVGIGYAIPYVIDVANGTKDNGFINIASQLLGTYIPGRNFGYITGRLEKFGFSAQSITDKNNAICVADITVGSQAYNSGMIVGDVIDSVQVLKSDGNGSFVAGSVIKADTLDKISSAISTMNIGDKLAVNLIRTSYTGQKTNHIATFTARQYIFCDTGLY